MKKIKDKKLNRIATKLAILGFFIAGAWAVFTYFVPEYTKSNIDENLYGIWYSKYNYEISHGKLFVEGTTEYFKNHNFTFVGEISLDAKMDNITFYTTYSVDATGTWSSADESFITTIMDMRSSPIYIRYDNKEISTQLVEKISGKKFPSIDEYIPNGLSEEFFIKKLDPNEILIDIDDIKGNTLSILMKKQKIRFQR